MTLQAINNQWKNPAVRFALLFVGLFCVFYYFHIFFNGIVTPGGLYSGFLDQHLNYIKGLRNFLLYATSESLTLLGYHNRTSDLALLVVGRGIIILSYDCLGLGVMSFFTAFVIAYPKSRKSKVILLLAGLIGIQALNIIRFILLSIYWQQKGKGWGIDHHTLFNVIIYVLIVITIYFWINDRQSSKSSKINVAN